MKVSGIQFETSKLDTNSPMYDILVKSGTKIPTMPKHIIKFKLSESNEALANAIRRVHNDELSVGVMNIHAEDFSTDDKFILPDNLFERLRLIPVREFSGKKSLKIENKTDRIIKIWSSDIKPNDGFNQNIQLCSLRPGKYLSMLNITMKKEYGYVDNAHTTGTFRFDSPIIGPSLEIDSTEFDMEIADNGQSSYAKMIKDIKDNLVSRLNRVMVLISNYEIPENVDQQVLANETNIKDIYILENTSIVDLHQTTLDSVYEIHIKNEYHTIGNLICAYVFMENPNIGLINYKMEHILKHKIIINIMASDYKKIIANAIKRCIKDIELWHDSISNEI